MSTLAPDPTPRAEAPGKLTLLCVDDEPQVLAGLALTLGRRYNLLTATGGAAALEVLQSRNDVAVVISDMRMPVMDGAAFLKRARLVAPDTVRMLLTGQADTDSAVAAVNEGQIFRFLTKPCPPVRLLGMVQSAVEHHRLITAERVLLEQTVRGSITALMDVLALADPVSFGRAARIRDCASRLAAAVKLPDPWEIEVAAMLSQLGYIALPDETTGKLARGEALSPEEADMVRRIPAISERLIGHIPRLEVVRGLLATLADPHHAPPPTLAPEKHAQISRGGRILRAAVAFEEREARRGPAGQGPAIHAEDEALDPELLAALQAVRSAQSREEIREVFLADIQVGMRFAEDVTMVEAGTLLVARGFEVTAGMVERARNIRKGTVKEPVRVVVARPKAP